MSDRFFQAPDENELTVSPAPAGHGAPNAPYRADTGGARPAAGKRKPGAWAKKDTASPGGDKGKVNSTGKRRSVAQNGPGLLDLLSIHLMICNERIKDRGEDDACVRFHAEAGILGVFDGCGGVGAKVCPSMSNKTEAYLASLAVRHAVQDWFQQQARTGFEWNLEQLKSRITKYLQILQRFTGDSGSRLKGSLVRSFPSTISLIACKLSGGELVTDHIWAGDSRTYCLDGGGLAQISVDDIHGQDAMDNLSKDGALTNVLSADGNYELHAKRFVPRLPCILFSASDGCFGYVASPMEFELLILSTMINAKNAVEWEDMLGKEFAARAGDDQSISLGAFGFRSYPEMKRFYQERLAYVQNVVQTFNESNAAIKSRIWEQYKPNYYRYSNNKE